jgi:hypothetical protein
MRDRYNLGLPPGADTEEELLLEEGRIHYSTISSLCSLLISIVRFYLSRLCYSWIEYVSKTTHHGTPRNRRLLLFQIVITSRDE